MKTRFAKPRTIPPTAWPVPDEFGSTQDLLGYPVKVKVGGRFKRLAAVPVRTGSTHWAIIDPGTGRRVAEMPGACTVPADVVRLAELQLRTVLQSQGKAGFLSSLSTAPYFLESLG